MTETVVLPCPRSCMPGVAVATRSIAGGHRCPVVGPRLGADARMPSLRLGAARRG